MWKSSRPWDFPCYASRAAPSTLSLDFGCLLCVVADIRGHPHAACESASKAFSPLVAGGDDVVNPDLQLSAIGQRNSASAQMISEYCTAGRITSLRYPNTLQNKCERSARKSLRWSTTPSTWRGTARESAAWKIATSSCIAAQNSATTITFDASRLRR
jgi:hypothetical protein